MVGVAVASLFFVSSSAYGRTCPVPAGSSPVVGEKSAQARLSYLRARLPPAQGNAKRWFWGWLGTYSALTVAQGAMIPAFQGQAQRQRGLAINAASAGLGALFLASSPPRILGLNQRVGRTEREGQGVCFTLSYLESELARAARKERFGTSWVMHGGNVLFNAGVGLVLGLAWGYWEYAFLTRMAGVLVGETLIWTRPTDADQILRDYRTGFWVTQPPLKPTMSVLPWISPQGAGLSLTVTM